MITRPNTGVTYRRRPRWRAYHWRRYSGQCGGCGGSGRCAYCDGTGGHGPPEWDMGAGFYDCETCDGTGACDWCGRSGWQEYWYWPRRRPVTGVGRPARYVRPRMLRAAAF